MKSFLRKQRTGNLNVHGEMSLQMVYLCQNLKVLLVFKNRLLKMYKRQKIFYLGISFWRTKKFNLVICAVAADLLKALHFWNWIPNFV